MGKTWSKTIVFYNLSPVNRRTNRGCKYNTFYAVAYHDQEEFEGMGRVVATRGICI
jgi:hypothetical protein